MRKTFEKGFSEAAILLNRLRDDARILDTLGEMAGRILSTFEADGKVLVCGNGGSMADAMHFAEEWTGRFRADRRPYPVLALGDPTHLTCVGNDYGFDQVFERLVRALGRPGDTLLVLSTSGNSRNLVLAAEAGRQQGVAVLGLLGRGGGDLLALCDVAAVMPGETSDRIQELHMLALHCLIEAVEGRLG